MLDSLGLQSWLFFLGLLVGLVVGLMGKHTTQRIAPLLVVFLFNRCGQWYPYKGLEYFREQNNRGGLVSLVDPQYNSRGDNTTALVKHNHTTVVPLYNRGNSVPSGSMYRRSMYRNTISPKLKTIKQHQYHAGNVIPPTNLEYYTTTIKSIQ